MTRLGRSQRRIVIVSILLAVVAIIAVIAISSLSGAYALFTSSGTATMTVAESGSSELAWNNSASGSDLSVAVGPLHPTQSVQRIADLVNTGTSSINRIQLSVVGTGTGSETDGIQLAIDSCTVAWAHSGDGYTCQGTMTVVSPDRPVLAAIDLGDASGAHDSGGRDHLRFTIRLPDTAPAALEGGSASVLFTATGTGAK